jgi:hypothetical protein
LLNTRFMEVWFPAAGPAHTTPTIAKKRISPFHSSSSG